MAEYQSKHGIVRKPSYELYMAFVDMRNFVQMLPEDKKEGISADYDSLSATVQGFNIGIKVVERIPYSEIRFEDNDAPFHFTVTIHFDQAPTGPMQTDFWIEVEAELNMMMKMMLGSKIKEALDKIVDALVCQATN